MKTLGHYEQYRELISRGSYAKNQILCKSHFISWSHTRRFQFGYKLVRQRARGMLLDYGFGDGTFLALVSHLFERSVGADPDLKQVIECSHRFSGISNLSFVSTDDVAGAEQTGMYALVMCMEVLEHCLPDTANKVLSDLRRLVSPGGAVIISVPVEIGPTLLAKQLLRRAAAWRSLGDYKYFEKYTWREFLKMLMADDHTTIERPVYFTDTRLRSGQFHGHKGFNWRALKPLIEQHFAVEQVKFSPAGWSRGYASSQAWFVCKPLAGRRTESAI
ncbi:MAG TPA: methyltransferase domain-containing protein [Candidatus Saccharimonadales bacterium]|nr:methyltransferase domain-containing protein [Candidatus Saccharimonadales bacterium]